MAGEGGRGPEGRPQWRGSAQDWDRCLSALHLWRVDRVQLGRRHGGRAPPAPALVPGPQPDDHPCRGNEIRDFHAQPISTLMRRP